MGDTVGFLQLTENAKQTSSKQFAALPLNQCGLNNHVGPATFILQRDEDNTGCRTRSLPTNHDARNANQGAIPKVCQIRGAQETPSLQSLAQQAQRMTAQAMPQLAVVRHQIFSQAGPWQRNGGLDYGPTGKQIALNSHGGNRPGGLSPMAGKAG